MSEARQAGKAMQGVGRGWTLVLLERVGIRTRTRCRVDAWGERVPETLPPALGSARVTSRRKEGRKVSLTLTCADAKPGVERRRVVGRRRGRRSHSDTCLHAHVSKVRKDLIQSRYTREASSNTTYPSPSTHLPRTLSYPILSCPILSYPILSSVYTKPNQAKLPVRRAGAKQIPIPLARACVR